MQGANRNSNMQSSACHSTTILFATRFKTGPEAKYSRYGFIVNLACPTVFSTCFIKCFILLQYLTDNLLPLRIYSYTFYLWQFLGPRSGGQAQELKEVLPAVVRDTVRDGKPRLGVAYQERHAQENHSEVFSGKKNMTSNMTFNVFFPVVICGSHRTLSRCWLLLHRCCKKRSTCKNARLPGSVKIGLQTFWRVRFGEKNTGKMAKTKIWKLFGHQRSYLILQAGGTSFQSGQEVGRVPSDERCWIWSRNALAGFQTSSDNLNRFTYYHVSVCCYECSFVSIWRVFIV